MMQRGLPSGETIIATSMRWNVPQPPALASRVRELLSGIYRELLDPDETQSVVMAAHELLENVVKYSAEGTGSFDAEICDRGGQAYVRLQTRNSAAPEDMSDLRRLVDRIGRAPDPVAIYDELVAASPHREGSGLGLARLRAEADMDIACSAEGPVITIVAERRVSIRNGAS